MRFILAFTHLLLFYGFAQSTSEPNGYDPVITSNYVNDRGIPVFYGTIREDATTVTLDPELKATDADEVGGAGFICTYRIVTPLSHHTIPFLIELQDRTTGAASIKVIEGKRLNFEKRASYKFSVAADDCGEYPRESNRAVVIIHVQDVDEFAPRFNQTSYFVEVQESQINENILQLKAVDDDRSPTYKGICGYEILTPTAPFKIDKQGVLSNIKELQYNHFHNYILKVVAVDCGQKRSQPVFVNIKIKQICKSGWQGIPEHIDYLPNSGRKRLAEQAHLQLCGDTCTPDKISVRITLSTKHIGKGCDRDTYSITSQRKLCGASGESVDLLPSPSLASNWTQNLPTDDGHESDQVFAFNGKSNAAEVPSGLFNHSLSEHFTLSTWMKHDPSESNPSNYRNAEKEHILCMSDGEYMSRHHYAWFIHGEKMIFLLRRESDPSGDMEIFKPAEWRWHITHINDGQWHHYAISVDFPDVRLYIDGKIFVADKKNHEIIDDWPLHYTSKVHFTKLVIGACWQGGESSFTHYFHGYLAGLSMLNDKTESDRVIKCLNNCKENLDFHALDEMSSGTTVMFNTDMTVFSFSSKNATELESLVSEIAYINFRHYPTPGRRNLNIQTSLYCAERKVNLPEVSTYVMVEQVRQPVISLGGTKTFTTNPNDLRMGQKVFLDIYISVDVHIEKEEMEDDDDEDSDMNETNDIETKVKKVAYKVSHQGRESKSEELILLDTCAIRAQPPLDLHIEHLALPEDLVSQFNMRLEGSETNSGLIISNADTIENYEMVLRGIYYYNTRAEEMSSRSLVLSCSSQSGRFISNSLDVEVIPVHVEPDVQIHAHAQQDSRVQSFGDDQKLHKISDTSLIKVSGDAPNVGMVAIIVVCVGFLLFMIILGVIRIRAAHRRTQVVNVEEKQEMEWDNSELNITVNPMEKEVFEYEDNPVKTLRDESDSEDDGSSYHDDGDSSEDEHAKVPDRELEWDDSTLSI